MHYLLPDGHLNESTVNKLPLRWFHKEAPLRADNEQVPSGSCGPMLAYKTKVHVSC